MTAGSIFPTLSLDRDECAWADYINEPTPFALASSGRWYKREDWFAPLGYGGINGSKLRQLLLLLEGQRPAGILTGASVLSPQVSMAALVAAHCRLPCTVVLGGTAPGTAMAHENVLIAAAAGAQFLFADVGYNPSLQANVAALAASPDFAGYFRLHYGITTAEDADPAAVEAFHSPGANQVANLDPAVRTLAMTFGSGNSCTSVVYGIARHRPPLERLVLFGVGPTRIGWLNRRLAALETATGSPIGSLFRRRYHEHPDLEERDNAAVPADAPYLLEHWDLHSTGFASYGDRKPFQLDGIDFHPTYEGKALAFMVHRPRDFAWWWLPQGDSAFWIVGSRPTRSAMLPYTPKAP